MTTTLALEWYRNMLWTAVITAGPIVLSIVIVGFLIAIVQAATQVNDQSVSFAPKAIVAVIALIVSGPWMLGTMSDFMRRSIETMSQLGP